MAIDRIYQLVVINESLCLACGAIYGTAWCSTKGWDQGWGADTGPQAHQPGSDMQNGRAQQRNAQTNLR